MGDRFKTLNEKHIKFISNQHLFFVATAADDGLINLSPKGMDTFRVIDESTAAWLNMTGSGNETAAHIRENTRMTIMFCSFDIQPLILRLYGQATAVHPRDENWSELIGLFDRNDGARQIFEIRIEMVQNSCGYGVPYFDLKGERPTLHKWVDQRGREGVEDYWLEKNRTSLDGKDTGISE